MLTLQTHPDGRLDIHFDPKGAGADTATHVTISAAPPRLEWSPTLCDGKQVDQEEARKACAALGPGWDLPERMELESILDLKRHDPAVDTSRFPDTKSTYYWTKTDCAWSSDGAWVVGFDLGHASHAHRDYEACVRAVRRVPAGQ